MPVVLLHPIGLDGRGWHFAPNSPLGGATRYDLLWHGGRKRPSEPMSLPSLAADVVRNTVGPLDLVGISMGAYVAMELAISWPGRVRSVLVACFSGGRGAPERLRARAEYAEQYGMSGLVEGTLQRWFTPSALAVDTHSGVSYARTTLLGDDPRAFAASWRALADNDIWSRLPRVAAPTTVLHAVHDVSVARADSVAVAARIPDAKVWMVPGPHLAHLEEPEAFEQATLSHLDRVAKFSRLTD